jgi:hypothetical protein
LDAIAKRCTEDEESDAREISASARKGGTDHEGGLLRAATEPAARVSVDGKDTGLKTPIGILDRVRVGIGKHHLSFQSQEGTTDIDIDVPPHQNACVYRVLNKQKGADGDHRLKSEPSRP